MKWLRDGRMFHHDAAIKGRTSGSTVEPQDERIGDFLRIRFKHPKHGHTGSTTIIRWQHAGIHFTFKLRIGGLDLFESAVECIVVDMVVIVVIRRRRERSS